MLIGKVQKNVINLITEETNKFNFPLTVFMRNVSQEAKHIHEHVSVGAADVIQPSSCIKFQQQ